jgi:hypothetical protein
VVAGCLLTVTITHFSILLRLLLADTEPIQHALLMDTRVYLQCRCAETTTDSINDLRTHSSHADSLDKSQQAE